MAKTHTMKVLVPLLIAVALAVGAAFAAWSWATHDAAMADLDRDGVLTTGTVISTTMAAGVNPTRYGQETPARYYVTYRFTDAAGTAHESMTNGTGTFFSSLARGSAIAIRYLPSDPSVNVYERSGSRLSSSPITIIVVLVGLAALCGAYAFAGRRSPAMAGN
jgi:hypothetical protein